MNELQRVGSMDSSCDEHNPGECAAPKLDHLHNSCSAASDVGQTCDDRRHSAPSGPPTAVIPKPRHGWRDSIGNSTAAVGALRIAGSMQHTLFHGDTTCTGALNHDGDIDISGSSAAQGVLPGRQLPFFSERLTGSVQGIIGELDGDHRHRGRVSPEEVPIDGVAKLKAHIRIPESLDGSKSLKRQSRQSTGGLSRCPSKHASAAGDASPVTSASSQATASSRASRLSAVSLPEGGPGKQKGGSQEGRRSSADIEGVEYDINGRSSRERGPAGTKKLSCRCCGVCEKDFTRLRRPHKCRMCRAFVCAPCSPSRVYVPGSGEHQRACKRCAGNSAPRVVAMASPQKAASRTLASRAPVNATVGSALRENSRRARARVFSSRKPATAAMPGASADLKLTSVCSPACVLAEVPSGAFVATGTASPVAGAGVRVGGLDAVRAVEGSSGGDVGGGFESPLHVGSDLSEGGSVMVTPGATTDENSADSPAARGSSASASLSPVTPERGLPPVSTAPADHDDRKVEGLIGADDADGGAKTSAISSRLPTRATRDVNGTSVTVGAGSVSDDAVGEVTVWPVDNGEDHDTLFSTAKGGDEEGKMVLEVMTPGTVPPRPAQQQQPASSLEECAMSERQASAVPEVVPLSIASEVEGTMAELAPELVDVRDDDSDGSATTEANSVGGPFVCNGVSDRGEAEERGHGHIVGSADHSGKEATCSENVMAHETVNHKVVSSVSLSESGNRKTVAVASNEGHVAVIESPTRGPVSSTSELHESRRHVFAAAKVPAVDGGSQGVGEKGWLVVLKEAIEKGSSCCHKGGTRGPSAGRAAIV